MVPRWRLHTCSGSVCTVGQSCVVRVLAMWLRVLAMWLRVLAMWLQVGLSHARTCETASFLQ